MYSYIKCGKIGDRVGVDRGKEYNSYLRSRLEWVPTRSRLYRLN